MGARVALEEALLLLGRCWSFPNPQTRQTQAMKQEMYPRRPSHPVQIQSEKGAQIAMMKPENLLPIRQKESVTDQKGYDESN